MSGLYRRSFFLFLMNATGGAFNYFFIYLTVKRLAVTELGQFSSELAIYMLCLSIAGVAQNWAVFSRPSAARFRLFQHVGLAVGLVTLFLAGFGVFSHSSVTTVLFAAFPAMTLVQVCSGHFQRVYAFFRFGLVSVLWAVLKFGFGFFSNTPNGFAMAFLFASSIVLVLASVGLRSVDKEVAESTEVPPDFGRQLTMSALTAVGYAWLPAYDLLTVRFLLGSTSAGMFSQLQLFSKITYHAPVTLLQISLPYYAKILKDSRPAPILHHLRKLEWRGLVASFSAIAVLAGLGPAFCEHVLHIHVFETREIALICLAVLPLYGLMSAIQIHVSAGKLGMAAAFIASTFLVIAVAWILGWKTVDQYLVYSAIANTVLGTVGWTLASRLLRRK